MNLEQLIHYLDLLQALYEEEYPRGDWPTVNTLITEIRAEVDILIRSKGKWPKGSIAIGNNQALSILKEIKDENKLSES